MRKTAELATVFTGGGLLYALIEILFRGFTHWSMIIVGGLAVLCLYFISAMNERVWRKWILGAAAILTVEFISGAILNILLGWQVWDYSGYRFHLYGQICLRFALYWLALCIPGNALCSLVRKRVFNHHGN